MGMGILLVTGSLLVAQPPAGDAVAINDRGFNIPVRFDEKQRPLIREVTLFESTDQGRQWNQRAVNPPSKDRFDVTVPADGSYWYVISILGQDGQRNPTDPSRAQRIMKVLVDTKKPDVRFTAVRQGDGVLAQWDIQEENPKLSTLKLEYRTADMASGQWTPVRIDPKLVGQAGIPVTVTAALTVRIEIHDEADNVGTGQVEIPAAAAPVGVAVPTALSGGGVSSDGGSGSPFSARPTNTSRDNVRPIPDTLEPAPASTGSVLPPPPSAAGAGHPGFVAVTGPQGPPLAPSAAGTPAAPPARGPVPGQEYVNTNRVSLKYAVDKVGASGLGSVELYVTRDDGATWQRLTAEQLTTGLPLEPGAAAADRTITADLPGEGRYGFYLIVRSGVGLGKQPPRSGDRPQMRVEVDVTAPEGTLYGLQPAPGQANAVIVRWKASDLNLAEKPIRLEWAERKGGPWTLVGDGDLPNTGAYTWKLPPNIPGRVYLKMTITDLARNAGVAETPEPVTIDLSEPEARIIGLGLSR